LVGERDVHGDGVGALNYLLERRQLDLELRGALGREVRIERDHAHAERARPPRDLAPDAPGADQAQRLAVELGAGERFSVPGARFHGAIGYRHAPYECEQQRERELGRRDGVARRGGEDRDAALGGRVDVDGVDADTRATDDAQAAGAGEGIARDFRGAADEHRVHVFHRAREPVARQARGVDDLEAAVVGEGA